MPKSSFIAQPDERLGDLLIKALADNGVPSEFVFVSAFASLAAVVRFKDMARQVVENGGTGRLVVGVDLGGTSKQVLQELFSWLVPVFVVKNTMPGVTFHPKLYLMRWHDRALIIIGSSNLTDGGMFRNYEAASITWYDLPAEDADYAAGLKQISRFVEPKPPTGNELTSAYLASLLALAEIPSEAEARVSRKRGPESAASRPSGIFGFESTLASPRLPPELQRLVLAARRGQRADHDKKAREHRQRAKELQGEELADPVTLADIIANVPQLEVPLAYLDPQAFYIHLPQMKADNSAIPGEMRIPLEALEVAPEFWGWPDMYADRQKSPRGGAATTEQREYKDRQAIWRTWALDNPTEIEETNVRMYLYLNSGDFRMMIGALNKFHGRRGDIVRVKSLYQDSAAYECVLARAGTEEHSEWQKHMVNPIRNSDRRFGYY